MKRKVKKPTERDKHILDWKIFGKGISWSRWCHLNDISVRQKGHSRACAPRQRVLMHKGGQCATS